MQVNRKIKRDKCREEEGPAPIGNDIQSLLTRQLDTDPAVILSWSGVEFCQSHPQQASESSEDISNIESKELLRYKGGVARLAHLAVQNKQRLLKTKETQHTAATSSSSQLSVGGDDPIVPSLLPVGGGDDPIVPQLLPKELIERHKLTTAEIRALPRFGKYEQGIPSKVIYIKNVHPRVTVADLLSMFGRFDTVGSGGKGVKIRLLTGRMRGQAFVEFKSVSIATEALELANGYSMYGKPLVISYGKRQIST